MTRSRVCAPRWRRPAGLASRSCPAARSPARSAGGWSTCSPTARACWRLTRSSGSWRCGATASSATCASAPNWRRSPASATPTRWSWPAYVPAPSLPVEEVVALVHRAGGVVALAHPGRLAPDEQERVVDGAIAAGVDGLEVWHSQHDDVTRRRLEATASRHGLLATGGSDYHGCHKPGVRLGSGSDGNVLVPARAVDDLKERLTAPPRRPVAAAPAVSPSPKPGAP